MLLLMAETWPTLITEPTTALLKRANGDPELALRAFSCREQLRAGAGGAMLGIPGGLAIVLAAPAAIVLNGYRKARLAFGIAHLRNHPTGDPTVRERVCRAAGLPDSFAEHAFHGAYEEFTKEGLKHGTEMLFYWIAKRDPRLASELASALGAEAASRLIGRVTPVVGSIVGGVMDWRETKHCAEKACHLFPPLPPR